MAIDRIVTLSTRALALSWPFTVDDAGDKITVELSRVTGAVLRGGKYLLLQLKRDGKLPTGAIAGTVPAGSVISLGDQLLTLAGDLTFAAGELTFDAPISTYGFTRPGTLIETFSVQHIATPDIALARTTYAQLSAGVGLGFDAGDFAGSLALPGPRGGYERFTIAGPTGSIPGGIRLGSNPFGGRQPASPNAGRAWNVTASIPAGQALVETTADLALSYDDGTQVGLQELAGSEGELGLGLPIWAEVLEDTVSETVLESGDDAEIVTVIDGAFRVRADRDYLPFDVLRDDEGRTWEIRGIERLDNRFNRIVCQRTL